MMNQLIRVEPKLDFALISPSQQQRSVGFIDRLVQHSLYFLFFEFLDGTHNASDPGRS